MFIILLTYKADLTEVDRHLDAHLKWLKAGQADGLFLAWGRKVPRTGGVIMARGDRARVEAYAARDPFILSGVADCEIVEFAPSMTAPGLEALAQ